jgi:hypothetical protein
LALLALLPAAASASFDHAAWDVLLACHVVELPGGGATAVDYDGFAQDRAALTAYLAAMSAVSRDVFDAWPAAEQLAFLVNAYNAWTVELILRGGPSIDSIKDLGSLLQSPWRKRFVDLLGETRTLDDVEHGLIRGSGRYGEPRIHFAINCASVGCPALRREAYAAARLDAQLDDATRRFLADRTRNRLEGRVLAVSSIFRWYRDDFATGWRGADSLGGFLALYGDALGLDAAQAEALASGELDIDFLDYDWKLNSVR